MTTDVGSFKSYQLSEGRTTPVPVRVSPTEKIRAEIDALFDGERELGEVIEDVARLGARLIIQTALEAEVEVFLGRARYQRTAAAVDARPGSRNGYSPATVKTTAGPVTVARPKLRGTTEAFASRLFGKTITRSNALESLVIAGFVRGLSVRDVENTLADALGAEAALSKSTVSRICQAIGDDFTAWSGRRLDGLQLDYQFLDASMFKMHPGARAEPVLAAWGITTDGAPVFVALAAGGSESADAWSDFLDGLRGRGLPPPLLVISDGAAGLINAAESVLARSLRQKCLIHRKCKETMRWFSVWGSMGWYGDLARGSRSAGVEVRGAAASSERAAAAVAAGGRGPVAGTRRGPGSRPVGRGEREHCPQGRFRVGGGPGSVPGRPCETGGRGPQERRRTGCGAGPGAAGAGGAG
jgi:hypothetical protein